MSVQNRQLQWCKQKTTEGNMTLCGDIVPHGDVPDMLAMTAVSALKRSAQTALIAATSTTCASLQHRLERLEGIAKCKNAGSGLHAYLSLQKVQSQMLQHKRR
jgi:hypothetical protein